MQHADVLIIGSGIAALCVAQQICKEKNVIIITKKTRDDNNSWMAQGGIAAAVAPTDHWMNHYDDTLQAGCQYNNREAVAYLVEQAPNEMIQLIENGMKFDRNEKGLSLGKEGAHGTNRILHAGGDATGMHVLTHIRKQVLENVTIVENEMVIDLVTQGGVCTGVLTRDEKDRIKAYYAPHTVLATGGVGSLYSFSSNNGTITGDGIAMAYRAGAQVTDLEFVQFHPTMLYVNNQSCGLVSEAVRGEGAVLVNSKGERFMHGIHPLADLAPRDIVARANHQQIMNGEKVYLDISMIDHFSTRFPTITSLCEEHGVEIGKNRIPIVPGAHFHMGGVKTNLDGETSIPGLYAVGEVACNGVHGANRLASNSLIEGIVFGHRLGEFLRRQRKEITKKVLVRKSITKKQVILPTVQEIQQMMMKYVGIVRDEEGLLMMKQWLTPYNNVSIHESLSNEEITIVNMVTVAYLITTASLQRQESIGGHYRSDYPNIKQIHESIVLTKKKQDHQLV
ncbi:L-aspartate oxidase [Ectobacillus sp. sgz5001026]|uniref:L-aspartate oxidase n=1 Tax=Ectobacillus sp. sgz5001026 TaxID=3242473 RepID=UPI0036D2B4B3